MESWTKDISVGFLEDFLDIGGCCADFEDCADYADIRTVRTLWGWTFEDNYYQHNDR